MHSDNQLLIASQNPGKISEFRQLLSPAFIVRAPSDFPKVRTPDVEENGVTYEENALIKARGFYQVFKIPVLSDDSGLECAALDGKPGLHSVRFGGTQLSWPDRWALLNKEIQKVNRGNRRAQFRALLCYFDGTNPPRFFRGAVSGEILETPRGAKGFGYDPIFLIPSLEKTMAELDTNTKNRISHRALAVKKFLDTYRVSHTQSLQ